MSPNNDDDSFNDNTCVVCFKNVDIYSVGDCDHPVCYECSTRMRVLCRQNECPICRHDMQKVIFTKDVQPFKELEKSVGTRLLLDRKFKIVFENADVQNAYNKLLAHVCSKCQGRHAFQTFVNLRDHMRKEHELFYCDLCVENLKILTHERRCYTRKELAMHRRQGDADNRSHRGHPLCEFCNERYMDNDELYRHLRRDHLFCHFCDADGLHHYYDSYDVLRNHFRDQHYLCEEGDCYDEKFTSAFRSEIDLKAHRASVHGRQLSKAAAKQARTLELEFTLKPRPQQYDRRGGTGRGHRQLNNFSDESEGAVGGLSMDFHRSSQQSKPPVPTFSTNSNEEFPSLGGSSVPVMQHGLHFPKRGQGSGRGPLTDKDFPALGHDTGPTASVSLRVNSVSVADRAKGGKPTNVSIHVNHRPSGVVATVSSSKNTRPQARESFPSLQDTYSNISSKLTSQAPAPSPQWTAREPEAKFSAKTKPLSSVPKPAQLKSYKPSDDDDFPMRNDFPALGSNLPSHLVSLASSQWSSGREPESKLSINKTNPSQPPPRSSQPKTFRIEDDFPSLNSRFDASCSFTPEPKAVEPKPPERKQKKESSISISVDNEWTKSLAGTSVDNISSDSDIGSKKSGKKKKSKTKNESSKEPSQSASTKGKASESSKKNKQKEEPKSKAKQIKVEVNKTLPNEGDDKGNKQSSKPQETAERKRSELTIDSLNDDLSHENNISLDDFPSLSNNRQPPGFVGAAKEKTPAPPGFEAPSNPPPGFSITLNSVARPSNGLTFTSSSGQSYPIPSGEAGAAGRVFSYVPPPNMKQRNAALVTRVTEALGSPAALDEFLQMSALFRQGSVTADIYHSHCREAMGTEAFMKIFPELLILLPDIGKQQELWHVAERSEWQLTVCAACGQVIRGADFKHHLATHSLENHFPALSNGLPTHNAWTSK